MSAFPIRNETAMVEAHLLLNKKRLWSTVLAILLLGVCWLYTADTQLYPWNGDPHSYLYAAQTLRAGEGLRNIDFHDPAQLTIQGPPDAPFTTWPPLYPILLAILGADLQAARVLNAFTLCLTVILLWRLYADYGIGWPVRLATLITYLAMLWPERHLLSASSETVFVPLVLAYVMALPRSSTPRGQIAIALLGAALPMTRYAGVGFVAAGTLMMLWQGRYRAAILCTIPVLAALALWFGRNLALTGALTWNTTPGHYTFPQTAFDILEVVRQWLTHMIPLSLIFVCLHAIWRLWPRRTSRSSSSAG